MAEAGLIYEKIPLIAAEIGAVGKSGTNVAQKYSYRSIDDVMAALKPVLAAHKVFCVPQVVNSERQQVESRQGTQLLYSILTVRYMFYAEDGSYIQAIVVGEGMDTGDKASNKAMAAAMKYALTQTFCIPTEESKDSEKDSPQVGQQQEQKKGWEPDETKPAEPPDESAPNCLKCGKPMKQRDGKKGPFWGCSGYPECDFTQNIPAAGEQQSIPENKPKTKDECQASLFQVCKDMDIDKEVFRAWVKTEYVGKGLSELAITKLRALEKASQERPEGLLEKVSLYEQQKHNAGEEPVADGDGGDAVPF